MLIKLLWLLLIQASLQSIAVSGERVEPEADVSFLQVSAGHNTGKIVFEQPPGAAAGQQADLRAGPNPDTVFFKVFVKNLFGIDFAASSWSSDIITHLVWTDARATALLPAGGKNFSMSLQAAKDSGVWLPDVSVTNLASWSGMSEISATLTINQNGSVVVTQRSLADLRSKYDVVNFPFDHQELKIRLASTALMADQLTMVAGLTPEELQEIRHDEAEELERLGWTLLDVSSDTVMESDGPLTKSRGELRLRIQRDWTTMITAVFLPELIMTFVPWSVFFSPLAAPYSMPRVAASLIPLLCMVSFMQKTMDMMPHSSGWTWLDLYEATCLLVIVLSFALNVVLQYVYQNLELSELATHMQHSARYFYIACVVAINTVAFLLRHFERMALAGTVVSLIFVSLFGLVSLKCWRDISSALAEKQSKEPEAH